MIPRPPPLRDEVSVACMTCLVASSGGAHSNHNRNKYHHQRRAFGIEWGLRDGSDDIIRDATLGWGTGGYWDSAITD